MKEQQDQREAEEARRRAKKTFSVFMFFVVALLVLAILILLWYTSQHVSLGSANAAGGGSIVPTPSSTSQAETAIQHYYDDINNRDYQDAANIWYPQTQSLANFQSGYSNTKHDTLIFGDTVSLANGTTKVFVTIDATELTASGGTRLSIYKGYYIVGQRGNMWKILNGILNRV